MTTGEREHNFLGVVLKVGFSVMAIDFCSALLSELRDRAKSLDIQTVHENILDFSKHIAKQVQVIICMGDTLTHLESLDAVQSLLADIKSKLVKNGTLVLSFRDYVSVEPHGTQRFIPVRSDESTILTCFLEYHEDVVEVYDLLYRKKRDRWLLSASSHLKLRLYKNWVCDQLRLG